MRRGAYALTALVLLLGASACAQTFDTTTLGVPVTMATPAGQAVEGTPFHTTSHSLHAVFGLLTLSQANLQKSLARQLVGGQQVTQLRIRTKSRFFDILVTGLTAGMLVPRTVIYEGVVIGR